MKQYAFILGNTPALSIAEILSVFKDSMIKEAHKEFLLIETEEMRDPQSVLDRLGGTIKIYAIHSSPTPIEDILLLYQGTGKLSFAMNLYGSSDKKYQKEVILTAKHFLKNRGLSCRFVNKDFKNTTSVQSFHEHLTSKGIEIGIFAGKDKDYVGKLIATQNIEEYSRRDFNKPGRNMKVGLMPPKLAQMMINLTGLARGKSIYDPFCGTGGLLLEALIMEYKIFGSDINAEALEQAKRNIEWVCKYINLRPTFLNNIFIQDAIHFDRASFPFDAIVTENYLGPVLSDAIHIEELENIESHLNHIYLPFFEKLYKRISMEIPVVICFPVFYIQGKAYPVTKTLAKVQELGYTASALLPKRVQEEANIFATDRNSIIYHREDQLVGREIFRFFKKD
jgi:tRNA G10  N-methylase Trm11